MIYMLFDDENLIIRHLHRYLKAISNCCIRHLFVYLGREWICEITKCACLCEGPSNRDRWIRCAFASSITSRVPAIFLFPANGSCSHRSTSPLDHFYRSASCWTIRELAVEKLIEWIGTYYAYQVADVCDMR